MSTTDQRGFDAAMWWVRCLAAAVTTGLLATVGVALGGYGREVPFSLSGSAKRVQADGALLPIDPDFLSGVAAVVHDLSVFVGIAALLAVGALVVRVTLRVGPSGRR
ncbi:MAG: hypothetical protein PPP55_13080 [Halorubrum sp.]